MHNGCKISVWLTTASPVSSYVFSPTALTLFELNIMMICSNIHNIYIYIYTCTQTGVLISLYSDQEGNKLQLQKIMGFLYRIYNHNLRNISTIYIYNKISNKGNILTIKKYIREVVRTKNLSAPLYTCFFCVHNIQVTCFRAFHIQIYR